MGRAGQPLRVVVTCDWFLKYAARQSAGLAARGANVVLLCRDHAHEFGGDERERQAALDLARSAGVRVLEIPGRISQPGALPGLVRLRRALSRFSPDIVHAHSRTDPRSLPLLHGVPSVLTLHDPVRHPGEALPALTKRWLLLGSRGAWQARSRVIIVHSEHLRGEVALAPGQVCEVIPHGIHVEPHALAPPSVPAVGFFGRMEPYKGLDVLSAAMPLVWQARPDVRLRAAGTGSAQIALEDRRVDLDRRYLPESGVPAFLAKITLAVLPYTQASQSGAGSVAAGYGIPLVVSRIGGLPDLVLDSSYIAAPGDPRGLANAILAHLDDSLAVRERVRREIAGPRSWAAVGAQTLQLYDQVLRRA